MQNRIDAICRQLASLVNRLQLEGYAFEHPDDAFPGPENGATAAIETIERQVGEVPLALKLFWLRVGSVDLSGSHPLWQADGYLDQLIVYPPSYALCELDEYLSDKEERDRYNEPYAVLVAPDPLHKAGVSGGPPRSVAIPALADDPPMNETFPSQTFLEHVENALRFGGFPGLVRIRDHSWPNLLAA